MTPFTKCFCTRGYTISMGMMLAMIVVYFRDIASSIFAFTLIIPSDDRGVIWAASTWADDMRSFIADCRGISFLSLM